jgi:hypothetical protein
VVFQGFGFDPDPRIYDYGEDSLSRVLVSHDWYAPMVISFVDPDDASVYAPRSYIAFDNVIEAEVDYIDVTVYDSSDNEVFSYLSASPEYVEIDLDSAVGAYMVLDDSSATAYVVDNLTF